MTLTVSPWVVWGVLSLALFGVVFVWRVARAAAFYAWEWWRRDRVTPLLEDDRPEGVLCAGCAGFDHCDGIEGGCDCTCGWPENWAELPPERSREELGFTGPRCYPGCPPGCDCSRLDVVNLAAARERRAPWWEAEHRAAYQALGFDYPSGLMARVRELAP